MCIRDRLLTLRKQEALIYLCDFLKTVDSENSVDYIAAYYKQKQKIEKAILKVDIEFLSNYHALLEEESINSIGELSKNKYANIKDLQDKISKVKEIEAEIILLEEQLFSKKNAHLKPRDNKAMKRVDARVINAYKKNKKE